jgi:oligo-1,6-glucosidase
MQWDVTKNSGFSSSDKPWMRVHDDYEKWNVEVQSKDPNSVNAFYKELFKLRNDQLVLVYGSFDHLKFDDEDVFAYVKEYEGQKVLVVLNYSGKNVEFSVPESVPTGNATLLLGSLGKGAIENGKVILEAWEGMLFSL